MYQHKLTSIIAFNKKLGYQIHHLIQYYSREYNSGEQQYLSLESVSIATGQDGKKTETVLNKLSGKTLLCPYLW